MRNSADLMPRHFLPHNNSQAHQQPVSGYAKWIKDRGKKVAKTWRILFIGPSPAFKPTDKAENAALNLPSTKPDIIHSCRICQPRHEQEGTVILMFRVYRANAARPSSMFAVTDRVTHGKCGNVPLLQSEKCCREHNFAIKIPCFYLFLWLI